jgi:hypothetical protein
MCWFENEIVANFCSECGKRINKDYTPSKLKGVKK